MRHLIGTLALVAVASVAGAQQQPTSSADRQPTAEQQHSMKQHKTAKKTARPNRTTYTSGGEVSLDRGGPGYAPHAVARDFVGADDTKCDALCQRERKMDAMCGKDREKCGKP